MGDKSVHFDRLTFKTATEPDEFEQIHSLNYRTFVEEIPQHPPNREKKLVDRFHAENTYFICLERTRLVGMLALRSRRPFSLDEKVADLDTYLPAGEKLCELRMLAVEQNYRKPGVFARLIGYAAENAIQRGYTMALASGTLRQQRLYHRMGFVPFAEPVGPPEARYQPMYLELHTAQVLLEHVKELCPETTMAVSFLPGPVEIAPAVQHAFRKPPISHRAEPFLEMAGEIKQQLRSLTGASDVELLLGSGTLANDVVAGQLKLLERPGVVLTNGEFGERLVDHAKRMGLSFETLNFDWGRSYDLNAVEKALEEHGDVTWLWTVHCETSTGMLNNLIELKSLCRERNILLCLDCTSSLGTVELNLSDVYLASGVSGKGLASYPGISFVFYNHTISSDNRLPRYLDLGLYREQQGVPFTHSSNLMAALHTSLLSLDAPERFTTINRIGTALRGRLKNAQFEVLTDVAQSSPAVISIALPHKLSSRQVGAHMERRGWLLSYKSRYLLDRNIIQICLMGTLDEERSEEMVDVFLELASREGR